MLTLLSIVVLSVIMTILALIYLTRLFVRLAKDAFNKPYER